MCHVDCEKCNAGEVNLSETPAGRRRGGSFFPKHVLGARIKVHCGVTTEATTIARAVVLGLYACDSYASRSVNRVQYLGSGCQRAVEGRAWTDETYANAKHKWALRYAENSDGNTTVRLRIYMGNSCFFV